MDRFVYSELLTSQSQTPLNLLHHYVEIVEKELAQLPLPAQPASLYDPQRFILKNGGKRIRPVFTLLSCGLCGGNYKDALPAALAVELLHNFTLMHDDIMDQAQSRRGKPAVHIKWNMSTAILAGDGLFTQSMLCLQKLNEPVDHKEISGVFLEAINHVCEGQAMDMEFETRQDVSTEEYLEMISGKTGALISASMEMGGMVAGADQKTRLLLRELGETLGYAFQIQDDWLDVVADPDKFGKKVAGDIVEGKKTFLMTLSLDTCNKEDKKWLLTCLNNKPLDDSLVRKVIALYKKLGVIEETEKRIDGYYNRAEKILEKFGESDYKRDLNNLIKTLKTREY
ncbi:MAG: polyprenyl synthetase family protein [Balneolaceae bacterium]